MVHSLRLALAFAVVLAVALTPWLPAQEPPTESALADLVVTQEGTFPVILSAPHGGREPVPGVPERRGEGIARGPSGFVTVVDVNTDKLVLAIAAAIEAKTGKRPYYVVARFARKYIDANRPPEIAYESDKAEPIYRAYHGTLERYGKEVKKAFGRGLLLDVHGQGAARDTIFRGTKDGKTVKLLAERFGEQAHSGPRSFFGLLADTGCKVFPEPGKKDKERSGFSGGYIVQTYGSHQGYGIDAIQLEFGGDYTDRGKLKATAAKLADAIDSYARLYLSDEPRTKP